MIRRISLCLLLAAAAPAQERINHAGRILGPAPVVATPILFNTPAADAVLAAMQIMPVDSPWNEVVSARPLAANSAAMIAQISADLQASRRTLRMFAEMNFVLVPDSQPTVSIPFLDYPDESDLDGGTSPNGLYPIPANMPVETWPRDQAALTLEQWQQDVNGTGGDRHAIIVKPGAGLIWEMWQAKRVGSAWQASNGAKFNLNSNALRPDGWTSADAAGLPMFPALVRYDECQRGEIEHALRIVVARTRRAYFYPATHYASSLADNAANANIPAMGQRLRLRAGFTAPANWSTAEKAVVKALQKYGALVADNGGFLSVSYCPDNRFAAGEFDNLRNIPVTEFEVIQATGPTGGPRSPGAPSVQAGPDLVTTPGVAVNLAGVATTPTLPATVQWRLYSGPGGATFGNAAQAATTVTFDRPGEHLLMLSASDGIHATAYDAVRVTVAPRIRMERSSGGLSVRVATASSVPYQLEAASIPSVDGWSPEGVPVAGTGTDWVVPVTGTGHTGRVFRVSAGP
jgi:hypothetical protein